MAIIVEVDSCDADDIISSTPQLLPLEVSIPSLKVTCMHTVRLKGLGDELPRSDANLNLLIQASIF